VTTLGEADQQALRECLAWAEEHEDVAEQRFDVKTFRRMLDDLESGKWSSLTEKQRGWARGVHERLFDSPTYENLWSAGKVPRGEYGKTPTPAVLQNLPKRPPGR
jgi:hypothetical protein